MPRSKKRGPSQGVNKAGSEEKTRGEADPSARKIPPPRPPTKNLPLLIACAVLFAAWLVVLGVLAWTS